MFGRRRLALAVLGSTLSLAWAASASATTITTYNQFSTWAVGCAYENLTDVDQCSRQGDLPELKGPAVNGHQQHAESADQSGFSLLDNAAGGNMANDEIADSSVGEALYFATVAPASEFDATISYSLGMAQVQNATGMAMPLGWSTWGGSPSSYLAEAGVGLGSNIQQPQAYQQAGSLCAGSCDTTIRCADGSDADGTDEKAEIDELTQPGDYTLTLHITCPGSLLPQGEYAAYLVAAGWADSEGTGAQVSGSGRLDQVTVRIVYP